MREREYMCSFDFFSPSPDLPSVDLLPPKVIEDLRDMAAYYHSSPGENHSGMCIITSVLPPPLTPLNISSIIHAHYSFSRHNEHVLPDSFEPVGKSTEFSQRRQPEPVSAGSKCNTQILNFCANFIFLFYVSFYRYPRNLVLVDVRKK